MKSLSIPGKDVISDGDCLEKKKGFFFYDDIATEILVRLPVKDLSACRCVSKRFNSLISNPSFLRIHFQRSAFVSEATSRLFIQDHQDNVDPVGEPISCISVGYRQVEAEQKADCDEFDDVEHESSGDEFDESNDKFVDIWEHALWDFLPEKVVLMASSNGLVCCRSCIHKEYFSKPVRQRKRCRHGVIPRSTMLDHTKEIVLYVCNPITKEYIALRANGCDVGDKFGLAFYPFGISNTNPCFKLVGIQCSKSSSNLYSFVVYSSDTGRWTTSKRLCNCEHRIRKNNVISIGHRFYWLTWGHQIITFDVKRDNSAVIELPVLNGPYKLCLGNSEGYLHFVCANRSEVQVWMLKDYCKCLWVLKYRLNLDDFYKQYDDMFRVVKVYKNLNIQPPLIPLAFCEDLFFFIWGMTIYSYNFKMRVLRNHCRVGSLARHITLTPTVLPYSECLAAMGFLKG